MPARTSQRTPYSMPAAWEIGSRNGGIRNLSMKKFGTPIGAAPESACEKVGLAGVGTPSPWRIAVASGWPSALAFLEAASSPVALRSALPTVFWPCWPPAETDGGPAVAVGAAAVAPGAALDGEASVCVVVSASAGGAGEELVSAGAGDSLGAELVPVSA